MSKAYTESPSILNGKVKQCRFLVKKVNNEAHLRYNQPTDILCL